MSGATCGLNSQERLYSQCMLTSANRLDVMNRLGRAMADPNRSRILMSLLDSPGYPGQLASEPITRNRDINHQRER